MFHFWASWGSSSFQISKCNQEAANLVLNTKRQHWICIGVLKTMSTSLVIFSNLELIFCWQGSHSQVEYPSQGQTRCTGILDCKTFCDTFYHFGHRLKLIFFLFALGSGPRYMICVTLFCTLREKSVRFSHVRVFSDSRNVQKRATKSDTSGNCLLCTFVAQCRSSSSLAPLLQNRAGKAMFQERFCGHVWPDLWSQQNPKVLVYSEKQCPYFASDNTDDKVLNRQQSQQYCYHSLESIFLSQS